MKFNSIEECEVQKSNWKRRWKNLCRLGMGIMNCGLNFTPSYIDNIENMLFNTKHIVYNCVEPSIEYKHMLFELLNSFSFF